MTATKPFSASPLDGYWGSDNSQHVNFIGVDQHVHELYIAPDTGGWVDNDLTTLAGPNVSVPNVVPMSQLHGFWGGDNSQMVNFVGVDYRVHRLYIEPNGPSWVDDPTAGAGLNTPLPGYWGSDGSKHVFFFAAGFSGSGLHELYTAPGAIEPSWVDNDLTALAGAVAPGETVLDAYWGSDSSQHVNFIGTDGHVHELYIAPNTPGWIDHDLTKLAAAVAPRAGTPLDAYWGSDSSQHVNFIGTDGHVHELYIAPNTPGWIDHDLTGAAAVAPRAGTPLDAGSHLTLGFFLRAYSRHRI